MIKVEKIAQLKGHSGAVYAMAPGREQNAIFSAGADNVVAEWNLESHEPNKFAIKTEETVYSLLNINRETLVIGTIKGTMHVIDLKTRQEIRNLQFHNQGVFHVLYMDVAKKVIACCADGSISVWNALDWSLERHIMLSTEKIRRVDANEKESLIAVASGDGIVRLLETSNFEIVTELNAHQGGANSVKFLENDDLVTGGKDAQLVYWTAAEGFMESQRVPAHNFAIYDIVKPDNLNWFATASRDKTVKIWNLDDLETPIRLDRASSGGHINSVNAALWLEDEKMLATCGDDRTVILWRIT